jgi:hypothetical protein
MLPITDEELSYVNDLKSKVENEGYVIVNMIGKPYHQGYKTIATFSEDSSLPPNSQIIKRVIKPQINHNGKMIQVSEIHVAQNLIDDYNSFEDKPEIPVTANDESPSTRPLIPQNTPQDVRTEYHGEVLCTGKKFME